MIQIIEIDIKEDDLVSVVNTVEVVRELKEKSIALFKEGGFNLQKWYSNIAELESENTQNSDTTYAKQFLPLNSSQTKVLGLEWCKENDTLFVATPSVNKN